MKAEKRHLTEDNEENEELRQKEEGKELTEKAETSRQKNKRIQQKSVRGVFLLLGLDPLLLQFFVAFVIFC